MKTFNYPEIKASSTEIIQEFRTNGYIAISQVPGFKTAYDELIDISREFTNLPLDVQGKYSPKDSYARGWSRGIEMFHKKKDTYKGSYYVTLPESPSYPNIWPSELPDFQSRYEKVVGIIHGVGEQVLSMLIDSLDETTVVSRMLHYSTIPKGEDDGNPNWCGSHKDHGLFTGLGPEVYFHSGKQTDKPSNSGLYILNNPAPNDAMLFQIGEALELISNGETTATEHYVRKAYGGYERFTLAVFFQPRDDLILNCDDGGVVEKYKDRYVKGMTYKNWNDRSFARYNTIS